MRKETRRIWLPAVFLLLAAISCQKKEEPLTVNESGHKVSVTFKAVEVQDADSKATFGNLASYGYPVLWEETDVAGVTVDYASSYQEASITPSSDALYGTFKANLVAPSGGPFEVQATVPKHALASYNPSASTVTVNIPASQTPTATGPDPMAMILVGEKELDAIPAADEDIELPFHHATAYGCVTLTNLPTDAEVDAIDLVFGVPITGKWDYSPSAQSMTEKVPSNIVTLHTKSVQNVFFACAPGNLKGQSLKIRLITVNGVYEHAITIDKDVAFRSGRLSKFTINMSEASKKTSVSILGIGHSYAVDSYRYLYGCLAQMGYTDIVLGVMFKGNCSLKQHVTYYHNGKGHEIYHKNTDGTWVQYKNPVLSTVLNERDWDYITMQECLEGSGQPSYFDPWLDELTDIVRNHQPSSKLFYNLLWTLDKVYTGPIPDTFYAPYNYDQMTMYNAYISTTQNTVMPTGIFSEVIPMGTAVQNLRTTYLEDVLTRDTYHMSYKYGRVLTALMMCRVFCNETIADVTYTGGYSLTDEEIALIKEALENAYVAPYKITPHGQSPTPGPGAFPAELPETIVWDDLD